MSGDLFTCLGYVEKRAHANKRFYVKDTCIVISNRINRSRTRRNCFELTDEYEVLRKVETYKKENKIEDMYEAARKYNLIIREQLRNGEQI